MLLVKPACLVVRSWSRSRHCARWKCALKFVHVFSLLGFAFHALQSSKYNPVLKTRVYAMRRSWFLLCMVDHRRRHNPVHPRVVGQGNQTGCWGPKGSAFWCRCLLIRVELCFRCFLKDEPGGCKLTDSCSPRDDHGGLERRCLRRR